MESGSSLDSVGRYFGYDSYYRFVILERVGSTVLSGVTRKRGIFRMQRLDLYQGECSGREISFPAGR